MHPPVVVSEDEVDSVKRKYGEKSILLAHHGLRSMILPSDHELFPILQEMIGRPRKRSKHGRLPEYPDRLAVRCALLKEKETYDEIGLRIQPELPDEVALQGRQTDITRSLVHRGRRLIIDLKLLRYEWYL
jgi:hypothetical protein